MKCYAQFFASHLATPYPDDFTTHDSLETAMRAFEAFVLEQERFSHEEHGFEGYVWKGEPPAMNPCDMSHHYPDVRFYLGQRRGIKRENL